MLSDNRFFFSFFFTFFFLLLGGVEFVRARLVNLSNPCHVEGQALSTVAKTATAVAIRGVAMPANSLQEDEVGIGVQLFFLVLKVGEKANIPPQFFEKGSAVGVTQQQLWGEGTPC